jgi:Na+/H+ antiporter NhaD/arsenite permease-like protein
MHKTALKLAAVGAAAAAFLPQPALAAETLPGATMTILWGLPFAGLLLSIATGPLFYPHVWEHHYGKFAAFWAACVVVPMVVSFGVWPASDALAHTLLLEYIPFILLLLALFTTAGGIYLEGNLHGTPATNTVLLGIGTVLASFVGTTGAAMILIRPVIRANDGRVYNVHVIVFFIFLVCNVGGALTPLGDPPLFVGFLKGVDFFWTLQNILVETLVVAGILMVLFFALDSWLYAREKPMPHRKDPTPDRPMKLHGLVNLALIGVVIAAILMSAYWKPGVSVHVLSADIQLQNVLRDLIFIAVTFASLALTAKSFRRHNNFSWGPILEVAKLFAAIFICIVPVIAILRAGHDGALAPLVAMVSHADGSNNNAAYFWLTGILSSFLDNAPTYLVFFELAGGDPHKLMTTFASTLAAISTGAVYMGANSYIGNAPNFMVYAIARHRGVKMPSFFGYMLWSGGILLPIFVLVTVVFFRS